MTIVPLEDGRLDRDDFESRLASFVLYLEAGNRAKNTIYTYGYALRDLAAFCESQGVDRTAGVTRQLCEAYLRYVNKKHSPSTAANRLKQLRGFFTWREGLLELPSPLRGIPKPIVVDDIPPCLSEDQLRRLLQTCDGQSHADRRDRAILRMFMDTGMRRTELLSIELSKIDRPTRSVSIVGKGGHERIVPWGRTTMRELSLYLDQRRAPKDGPDHGFVWTTKAGDHMGRQGLNVLVNTRGRQAGILGMHCHLFRHTFAHMWLESGGEEVDLMRLGGWRTRHAVRLYGRAEAHRRAVGAHERHGPGDRLKV